MIRRLADLDRRPLDWERVALWATIVLAFLTSLWISHEWGRARESALTLDAFHREAHYRALGLTLLDHSTRALSVVLAEDVYLHERIRDAVPEWHSMVVVGRAVLEP